MLTYVPFLGWVSSDLVTPFIIVALSGLAWAAKMYYVNYAEKRDMKKIYTWLLGNTGPKADLYDLSSKEIAGSIGLPTDRVRKLCTMHPKIKASHKGLDDSWKVHEYDTQIRWV